MTQNPKSTKLHQMVLIAAMTAAICVVSPFAVPLPFTAIPITFSMFMIMLAAFILGTKRGVLACLLYLAIGSVGVPVFSGFTGGLQKFVGPTGGYLVGYLFLALMSGLFVEFAELRAFKQRTKIACYAFGMCLGIALLYFFGTLWFMIANGTPFTVPSILSVLGMCVFPFLPGDIAKVVMTIVVGVPIKKALYKAGLI